LGRLFTIISLRVLFLVTLVIFSELISFWQIVDWGSTGKSCPKLLNFSAYLISRFLSFASACASDETSRDLKGLSPGFYTGLGSPSPSLCLDSSEIIHGSDLLSFYLFLIYLSSSVSLSRFMLISEPASYPSSKADCSLL
jgi:hypothetical protein